MPQSTPVPFSDTITAGCGATVDSRASSCSNCGLVFGYAGSADHRLWVPLRTPDDHGPRAYAAQMLEMVLSYGLIQDARLNDGDGFVVVDQGEHRELSAAQVLDEYGDRLADMVTAVMEHSDLTTTDVPVKVGAVGGPVPFVEHPDDRLTEYGQYWPERAA